MHHNSALICFVLLCITTNLHVVHSALTVAEIDELRVLVLDKIDTFGNVDDGAEDKPLIGSLVRMLFHDCAGPFNPGSTVDTLDNSIRLCDGCIDFELLDHRGLKEFAIDPIEDICTRFRDRMNRADCWAAVANVALEYSASLSTVAGTLPILPYFFGRTECDTSPDAVTDVETGGTEFPMAHLGWDPINLWFKTNFDFNRDEVAAIIGAHTLGRAHATGSGFQGKWTTDSFAFNNKFYVELLDQTQQWDQVTVSTSPFPQWENTGRQTGEEELMMLNADIAVVAAFENNGDINEQTGAVRCRWEGFTQFEAPTCPREQTFDISLIYARDNQRFLDDFADVWNKLVTHNQFNLERVDPNRFVDVREGTSSTTATPVTNGDVGFCCVANRVPNWNGRCWGATSEQECFDAAPGNGRRCRWDPLQCKQTLTCSLRDVPCTDNDACCSKRCRPDINACR